MIVRLGYVAISNKLGNKVTSSSTVTFKNYSKILTYDKKMEKLKLVTSKNLASLEKLIQYNIENNIHFYRITSALIPLFTHPEVGDWGYREIFKKDFQYIGKLIKESNMRVDIHPDQFNVINSINPMVVESTKKALMLYCHWFEDLNYDNGKMVLHIGGANGGKENGLKRFIDNFNKYPEKIRKRVILENDDKTYTAKETLNLCKILNIPMVLDVHHHNCNNNGECLRDMLQDIFNTWEKEPLPPKIHFSSPRDGEFDRKHADYINYFEFIKFIELAKDYTDRLDVMLECKEKDMALYKLVNDIKENYKYNFIDESTIEFK